MYIESLLQQKDLLLRQMKDLLLVNDTFNLQKLKNEYDYIINRIDNLNFGKIKTNYLNNTETGGETYSHVSFSNKINPKHAKYIKEFKNPVADYNFLLDNKEIYKVNTNKENFVQTNQDSLQTNKDSIQTHKTNKNSGFNGINGDGLRITDCDESNEMEYNNESSYNDYTTY